MKDKKLLFKLLDQLATSKPYATVFSEVLDYFLTGYKLYETTDQRKAALISIQEHPQVTLHMQILSEIGELSENFYDIIGEVFELNISKGKNGQFFTPEPITTFMATIVAVDGLQPGQSVYDPACGSGRMLVSAAKINRHLRFYGADIDALCCKMALVNMLLQSLTGEIAHMNSLSNEFFCAYATGTVLHDGYHYPYYKEITNPEESYIWLKGSAAFTKPKPSFDKPFNPVSNGPTVGVQGTLFDL